MEAITVARRTSYVKRRTLEIMTYDVRFTFSCCNDNGAGADIAANAIRIAGFLGVRLAEREPLILAKDTTLRWITPH